MVALDESYRDPTNLQSKLQKHQAFEAELSANKGGVDTICKVKMIFSAVRLSFISSVYLGLYQFAVSVSLSDCLSVCLSICLSVCLCVICTSVFLFAIQSFSSPRLEMG